MLMKISVQNPILPTVILHLVFSVWVAHVRNLLPWVLPSCWKENHQEIYSDYWWQDSGTEARCVGSYIIMPVELIDIFWTENLEIICKDFNFIVDGCHFQGQRKMKKSTSGKASHLGCSESYSFMAYKPYTQLQIDGAHNSQEREKLHSVLEKLAPSLRQMNYSNFMRTLIIFFSVHNLWTMDKL